MELSLKDFWPSQSNCDECLITEAETADVAVFLAVHQPMRLFRHHIMSQMAPEKMTEADLLNAFLVKNLPSGTLLVPIVGNSGVGKSHMIRWLDAHLRTHDDGVSRHIVRIPKSASLRRVLELILEELPDERYGSLRQELTSARMPPDLLSATFNLLAKLLIALERSFQEARTRISEGNARPDDRERMTHCDPRGLPALLQDSEVSSHFKNYEGATKGVLARIVERYMQGANSVEGPANQFTESDLVFDDTLDQAKLSHTARSYLVNLNRDGGKARKIAVSILNDVVDPALAELLDFGGLSLTDIFVKMREQLLKDDKELVLLVEDFAALAGIQGSLLDAMIREGIRDGRRQLCVMRTALAVTEGYLPKRETVRTRAQYEWRIEEKPFANDDEAITTFTNFIGGYLNAARWGKTRLEKAFKKRLQGVSDLQTWLPNYYDEHQEDLPAEATSILKEFGFSRQGNHPLFPFNHGAIHQLARRYLREGSSFVLNPRKLLNFILRETLIGNRPLFDAGSFPPATFQQFARKQLATKVSTELNQRADSSTSDRLAVLIFYWGDNPQTAGEAASMSPAIYSAFGLLPIKWSAAPEQIIRSAKEEVKKDNEATGREVERRDPWVQKLQDWREQGRISQADANMVRKQLAIAITEWIDWEALVIKADALSHLLIALPNASTGSNPTSANTMAVTITEEELKNPARADQFYTAIGAVIRFHNRERSWNYDGGEVDSAAYANLVDDMAAQAVRWLKRQAHALPREGIRPLAQGLLIGARILGLEGATSNVDAENLAAIFSSAQSDDSADLDTEDQWSKLRTGARNFRADAKELLLRLVAARQGAGDTVQAIDATELLAAIRELRGSWLLPANLNLGLFEEHRSLVEHMRNLRNLLKNAATQRATALDLWRKQINEWLGPDFEVHSLVEELRKTAQVAQQVAVFRGAGVTYETLRDSLNKLSECKLKETLELAEKATEAKDFGVVLSALAQVDSRKERASLRTLEQYAGFLQATTATTDEKLATAPPSIAEEGRQRALQVEKLEKLWQEVEAIQ